MANGSDLGGDLVAWQLSPFAWLRAPCAFDLEFVSRNEILGRDAQPGRCNLLGPSVLWVAARSAFEPAAVFAAFAAVAPRAKPVHRNGQRFVSFLRKRTK